MRGGRGFLITGAFLVLGSIVGIIVSVGVFFSSVVSGVDRVVSAPSHPLPAVRQPIRLTAGGHVVYLLDGGGSGSVTASDVQVIGPSGAPVGVRPRTGTSVTNGSGSFRSVAAFTAPTSGTYTLTVDGNPGGLVLVSADLGEAFAGLRGKVLAGVGSVVLLLVGLVVLVIGLVRSVRSRPSSPYPPPPPGYPPPPPGYPPPPPGYPPAPRR